VTLIELHGAGHMEYLEPGSEAHATLCAWLDDVMPQTGSKPADGSG
jgi:hypothetical protein